MLTGVDVDELQHALGGVVLEAACLERVLRAAFRRWSAAGTQPGDAADDPRTAMTAALGSGWVQAEDQLRQQTGHDSGAGPGS